MKKYIIILLSMLLLAGSLSNAQEIKRQKQKSEQTSKPKQNKDSKKSSKTTSKSSKTEDQKSNNSSPKKNKSQKAATASSTQSSTPSRSNSGSSSPQSTAPAIPHAETTTYDVTFSCNASYANMYIDGHFWGRPQGTHSLKAGSYQVKINADGYEDFTTTINVAQGSTWFNFEMARLGSSGPYVPKVETFTVKGISFDMIFVEGGSFTMGATIEQNKDATAIEEPAHAVTLSGYYIGKFEVTQELWKAIMGKNPSTFNGNLNNPVECVSWKDCQKFVKKLSQLTGRQFRLPTEAEWEYAARGGKWSMGYKFAGSNHFYTVAWYKNNSEGKTHPVGQMSPNELGIYDMSGNVYEWCQDWYGSYSRSSQTNPSGPSKGSERVFRGGNWSYDAWYSRVSNRDYDDPSAKYNYVGLRLAL